MKNRSIILRKYYALRVELASPLCISGGDDDDTDADVLVNGSGEAFVPGTSIAGAMRNYLEIEKSRDCIFGYSKDEMGRMSSVYISDLYFDKQDQAPVDSVQLTDEKTENNKSDSQKKHPVISVRDFVQLTDEKTVNNKFDMQVIETGEIGTIYLDYVVRQGEEKESLDRDITDIIHAIQDGTIRFGANKNRGMGRFTVTDIYERTFDFTGGDAAAEWISFMREKKILSAYGAPKTFADWEKGQRSSRIPKYVTITVPLKLTGGISIRKYSVEPGKADFEHITCNGKPVIPGSSWGGAIRADVRDILEQLGCNREKIKKLMDIWFGFVDVKNPEKASKTGGQSTETKNAPKADGQSTDTKYAAEQSRVVIAESVIEGAVALPMTRNRINRFDASTINGALYSEIAYFGGTTELKLMVREDAEGSDEHAVSALIGVLSMVTEDIRNGYVAVGGQTAVGRGIFSAGEKDVEYSKKISLSKCMEELYALVMEEGKHAVG